MANRYFSYGILLSLLVHSAAFLSFYRRNVSVDPQKPNMPRLEVTYKRNVEKVSDNSDSLKNSFQVQKKDLPPPKSPPIRVHEKGSLPIPQIQTSAKKQSVQKAFFKTKKRHLFGTHKLDVQQRKSVAVRASEKLNNAKYMNYLDRVSMQIERYSNRHRDQNIPSGEVHVVFVLNSKGQIEQIKTRDEDGTYSPQALRDAAMKFVQSASPYPEFPLDLSLPVMTFKVSITIEPRG